MRSRLRELRFRALAPSVSIAPANNDIVAVYVGHRILFNRIKKSGNSSTLLFLDQLAHGVTPEGEYIDVKNASIGRTLTPFGLPAREIRRLDSYYSFTIFRNPYTRCLSMFLNKVAPGRWEVFSSAAGFGDRSPAGFERFVRFLDDGGIHAEPHFYPQTRLLFFEPRYFSRIGQLENLEHELRRLCRHVGLVYPDDLKASGPHQIEINTPERVHNANQRLSEFYTTDLCDRVRRIYRTDFEVGGYDTAFPI